MNYDIFLSWYIKLKKIISDITADMDLPQPVLNQFDQVIHLHCKYPKTFIDIYNSNNLLDWTDSELVPGTIKTEL